MSARRRTDRDRRRRTYGQNFLVDRSVVSQFVRRLDLVHDEVVVEVGAGAGALTIPLARTGARVVAVEADPVLVGRLRDRLTTARIADRVRVVQADFRRFRWPAESYRVVANPPFGLTSALLVRLLDQPERGPVRADLIVQWEVARKRAAEPPSPLHGATWAPWWSFMIGMRIVRRAFRPVPNVDAAMLTIRRREPSILPVWLAPSFRELLRRGCVHHLPATHHPVGGMKLHVGEPASDACPGLPMIPRSRGAQAAVSVRTPSRA